MVNAAKVMTQICKFYQKIHIFVISHPILMVRGLNLHRILGYNLFLQTISGFCHLLPEFTCFSFFRSGLVWTGFGPVFLVLDPGS